MSCIKIYAVKPKSLDFSNALKPEQILNLRIYFNGMNVAVKLKKSGTSRSRKNI